METLDFTFTSEEKVEFFIDHDPEQKWLSQFDSKIGQRFFIVIDSYIDENWGKVILEKLESHGKHCKWIVFDAQEKNKSLDGYVDMIRVLEKKGLSRFDTLIAIGGGVVLDIISLVASTYMRGVPLIMVPTTLIGQMDASTAGKTCINSVAKNLVGTLYFARYVYNNTCFLETLSPYYFRQGLSEVFKYGLLGSSKLLDLVDAYREDRSGETLKAMIKESIYVRIKIRRVDPLASNLGHTFGHAFEKISNFQIDHGDAISAGVLMALTFGVQKGITPAELVKAVEKRMLQNGLNLSFSPDWDIDAIVDLMAHDKKSSSESINLVMIRDIDQPYSTASSPFYAAQKEDVRNFLRDYFETHAHYANQDLYNYLKV
jgi:3-dehydroquinate synthase